MVFKIIIVVVCDKISICGQTRFAMVDKLFLEYKQDNWDDIFDGIFLYLYGDNAQIFPLLFHV